MADAKLYMILLGATPPGRTIEQHDIFFGIASDLKSLVPDIICYWPEADGRIHIDGWQEVQYAGSYEVHVRDRAAQGVPADDVKLFFINLGGYKPGEFEEYHYKMVMAAKNKAEAIKLAKETAFYKHTGFKGAESHVDDKFGVDVDDAYQIEEILSSKFKEKYRIDLVKREGKGENKLNIGYFILNKL